MNKVYLVLVLLMVLAAPSCKKSGFLKKNYIRFKVNNHEQVEYRGDETSYQHLEADFNNMYTIIYGQHSAADYFYLACNRSFDITTGKYVKDDIVFTLDSITVDFGRFGHKEYTEGSFYGSGFDSSSGSRITISEGEFYINN